MTKENNKKKGSSLTTWLLVLVMIAGLSLLLYPTFADWWNSFHASRAISSYSENIASLDTSEIDRMWKEAEEFNAGVQATNVLTSISDERLAQYNNTLNVTGTGIMGYVEIPKIRVELPIYHGTSDTILQIAIGHLENTTLPVGGASTHCVISGHRGLPSAKLFTDIDKLVEGDTFMLEVLGRTLTYEVDQIRVVLPYELSNLVIEENMDYCTLVNCTPYGVNSHRLLVRGRRTENAPEEVYVPADATQIQPIYIAPFVGAPILLILLIYLLVSTSNNKRRN
ncbi:MAG: class C sortase [Solobacterium sp.]|nr:class C sortase [Solobacterium sp.]